MSTIEILRETVSILKQDPIPRAEKLWGGADVKILSHSPEPGDNRNFYGEPRCVITPKARELSWLFERLRDAFYAEDRIDGCSKIEFFGRLANAANRCVSQGHSSDEFLICLAVLQEAFVIYEEMESGRFNFLAAAPGGQIADDSVADDGAPSRYRDPQQTFRFFRDRALDVGQES